MGLRKTMNSLNVKKVTVDEATHYANENNENPGKWTPLVINNIDVIKNGMESGNPTVDIQMTNPETGQKFIVMTTGALFNMAAKIVESEIKK